MLAGDFQRKLRKLNPRLHIYSRGYNDWPAGIFHVVGGEYTEICGIDKNIVPEYSVYKETGAHYKGGWRRALKLLIKQGLIDRRNAEKLFRTTLNYGRKKKTKRDNSIPARRIS